MQVKELQKVENRMRLAVVFSSGEEAIRGLTELARARQLSGAHFTGIGALRAAMLGFYRRRQVQWRHPWGPSPRSARATDVGGRAD
jgi:predicted DNA-binding protein with PD1-like motif